MNHLQFDFNGKSYRFCQPVKIIQTHHLHEIIDCFKALQQALQQGYYIAGYLAYEAAPALTPYLVTHHKGAMPLLWFGVFNKIEETIPTEPLLNHELLNWQIDTSLQVYQQAIQTIRDEIGQGNVYQVNYTVRLDTEISPDSCYALYQTIRQAQQSKYSAYLNMGRFQLLSASPELFFHWQNGTITTKPMKGTIGRGKTEAEDNINRRLLKHSTKDQAENLMIVDLLRNDLSKIADLNSIKVPKLFTVETYPTVLQMTSTITAKTKPEITLLDIFKALFPCGSITGAPKASAMNIIKELETSPREAYCGAIGFVTPDQQAIFNVPIRTIQVDTQQQTATYGVGGGITWGSSDKNEYQEILTKAKVLTHTEKTFQLLESLLLINGQYLLLAQHIKRLKSSARYFNFNFSYQNIKKALQQLAINYTLGTYKVRLLLNQQGKTSIEADAINLTAEPLFASWSATKMDSNNTLLYHKTTHRTHYPQITIDCENLLTNERHEVTEFVNGNLVILLNGQWLTPAIQSGLLAGTMRQWLLSNNYIQERTVSKQDVQQASDIYFINSVRGIRKVILK